MTVIARKAAIAAAATTLAAGITWGQLAQARRSLPQVWTETVARRDVIATVTVRGRFTRPRTRTLSAGANGRVRAVLVRAGESVRAGQVMLVFDDAPLRVEVERARAAEQGARSEVVRAGAEAEVGALTAASAAQAARRRESLFARGLIPAAELDAARHDERIAQLESIASSRRLSMAAARERVAQDRVTEAVRALNSAVERAPVDGVVGQVLVRAGEWVQAGGPHVPPTRLLTIADPGLVVEAPVEATDALRLPVGLSATVVMDADPSREWPAHLAAVVGRPGAVAVRLRLRDAPTMALEGMSSTVRFTAASRDGSVSVPNHTLLRLASGAGVWTVAQGAIAPRAVTIGLRGDEYSEILSGVSPGQSVVTGPYAVLRTLRPGDAVAVAARSRRQSSSFVLSLNDGWDEGSD